MEMDVWTAPLPILGSRQHQTMRAFQCEVERASDSAISSIPEAKQVCKSMVCESCLVTAMRESSTLDGGCRPKDHIWARSTQLTVTLMHVQRNHMSLSSVYNIHKFLDSSVQTQVIEIDCLVIAWRQRGCTVGNVTIKLWW